MGLARRGAGCDEDMTAEASGTPSRDGGWWCSESHWSDLNRRPRRDDLGQFGQVLVRTLLGYVDFRPNFPNPARNLLTSLQSNGNHAGPVSPHHHPFERTLDDPWP